MAAVPARMNMRRKTGDRRNVPQFLPCGYVADQGWIPEARASNDPARKAALRASNKRRQTMKYICLGYIEPGKFEGMTEDERNAVIDECFEHNDHLRSNGHLVAELALQPPETALTLYWKNGKVATTDGPYTETKE